ncbi:MAG: hypothetical protein Q9178_001026 [Gyalolechia marmorata]
MDHLPLPVDNLAHAPISVPYLCNERFSYDDRGFLTYPSRCTIDIWTLCERDEISSEKWVPFLQAWLWVGLLADTVGIKACTPVLQRTRSFASFILTDLDESRFLTTRDLYDYIEVASKKNQGPLFNDYQLSRFDACLVETNRAAKEVLKTLSSVSNIEQAASFSGLPIVYTVLLSIQILAETLYFSRKKLFPKRSLYLHSEPEGLRPTPTLVDLLLKQSGWCPFTIRRLPKDVRIRYYLSYMSPFDQRGHKQCTQQACKWGLFEDDQIHPQHTSNDCQCSSVTIPDAEVTGSIQSGTIALLSFPEISGGKRELKISQYPLEQANASNPLSPEFVAVSHIRYVGLGNAQSHALPYCQLCFLQMTANEVSGAGTSATVGENTQFWIDTMCLPLDRAAKKAALRGLHEVYTSAYKVVVLDPSLLEAAVSSAQDAVFRIRYSLWKTRLWTLQEGMLAREVYIRFKNRTHRLGELVTEYEGSPHRLLSPTTLPLCSEVRLKELLATLDSDIKALLETRESATFDKGRLYMYLRLGYLASPLYRYFCEEHEAAGSAGVIRALLQIGDSQGAIMGAVGKPNDAANVVQAGLRRVREFDERLRDIFPAKEAH